MAVFTRIDNAFPLTPGGPSFPGSLLWAFFGDGKILLSESSTHWSFGDVGGEDAGQVITFSGSGMSFSGGLFEGTISSLTWSWGEVDPVLLATMTGINVTVSVTKMRDLFAPTQSGDDTFIGIPFGEEIRGENGDDIIYGNGGGDGLYGANGNDTIHGGNDADVITGDHGEFYNDPLEGDDLAYGYGGNDNITGGHGNDTLFGGGGAENFLSGEWGDDSLVGGGTVGDAILGGDGDDTVEGGLGGDWLRGGENSSAGDTLSFARFDPASGTQGVTVNLSILAVQDTGAGLDSIDEFENIWGSAYDDVLTADDGLNTVLGRSGDDRLNGADGDDSLAGGNGNDTLDGGAGNDTLNGGDGVDRIVFSGPAAATVNLGRASAQDTGQGTDLLRNVEGVTSGDGNDRLTGGALDNSMISGAGNDTLYGGAGNDTLDGGGDNDWIDGGTGDDLIDGGDGSDRAVFTGPVAATVNLALTTAQDTGRGTDTILNVENITSGSGNDSLAGNALDNSLVAGSGNDTLAGGASNDTLTGGTGSDVFVFDTARGPTNVDKILDFSAIDDRIHLDDAVFAGITAGTLAASAFEANLMGTATDGSIRLIYEIDTGRLYFDTNGSAGGGRVHFATLAANLALTNEDIFVF